MENSELLLLAGNLEAERSLIMTGNNVAGISELFSDDLYYGHASGLTDSKQSYLDKLSHKVFSYLHVEVHVSSVNALNENAFLVTGTEKSSLIAGGEEKRFDFIYMGVWRKENGKWRFLGHQTAVEKK